MDFVNPLKPLDLRTVMDPNLASVALSPKEAFNPVVYKDNPVYHQPWFWVGYWRSLAERLGDETVARSAKIKEMEEEIEKLKKELQIGKDPIQ